MTEKKKKDSIIAGALTGSVGAFLTKALGLLYVIPFNEIAQSQTVFYSYGYSIYDYILTICLGGIPYGIAALISKYNAREDYESAALVKEISKKVMLYFGLASALLLVLFANTFAKMVIPDSLESTDYLVKTRNVIYLVSLALIVVPILSYYRGVYQGLKDFKVYAFTQVVEQIIRIGFLLGGGALCVYILKLPRISSVYCAILAASISALGCLIYFHGKEKDNPLNKVEIKDTSKKKQLFKELMIFSVPYLLATVIANGSSMLILLTLSKGLEAFGMEGVEITVYQGIMNYQSAKITSIPQIIGTGFIISIVPHLSAAVGKEDIKETSRLIGKVVKTAIYMALPLLAFMILYEGDIYHVLYGTYEFEKGVTILTRSLAVMFTSIVLQITATTLLAINMRKEYLILQFLKSVLVVSTLYFNLSHWGINGYYLTMLVGNLFFIISSYWILNRRIKINFKDIFSNLGNMVLATGIMLVVGIVGQRIMGYEPVNGSRIMSLIQGGIMGLICGLVYLSVTQTFKLPEDLLGFDFSFAGIKKLLKKG